MVGTIDKLIQSLKEGRVCSCYLLYGDETFLIEEALRKILQTLLPDGPNDLNCFRLDGGSASVAEILEAVRTPSLIPGKKVVIVKNTDLFASSSVKFRLPENFLETLSENPGAAVRSFLDMLGARGWSINDLAGEGWRGISEDEWERIFKGTDVTDVSEVLPGVIDHCIERGMEGRSPGDDAAQLEPAISGGLPHDHVLILTAHDVDKRKKLYKILSEKGVVLNFERNKSDARQRGILAVRMKEYLAERGVKITTEALELLIERSGLDFGDVVGEGEKLLIYLGEGRNRIDLKDVEEVASGTGEGRIFELTDALVEKDLEKGLKVLKRFMDQGIQPLILLSVIARAVRFLLQAKFLVHSGHIPPAGASLTYRRFQDGVYPELVKKIAKGAKDKADLWNGHPYVIYKTIKGAERFSRAELVHLVDALVETDIALKSSGGDPGVLLERLIWEASGTAAT